VGIRLGAIGAQGVRIFVDVDADCTYTGLVEHDVTSLLHAVMHTVVVVMTTVMLNPRICKFRGHIILFYMNAQVESILTL
jgi:hypothetical protein